MIVEPQHPGFRPWRYEVAIHTGLRARRVAREIVKAAGHKPEGSGLALEHAKSIAQQIETETGVEMRVGSHGYAF